MKNAWLVRSFTLKGHEVKHNTSRLRNKKALVYSYPLLRNDSTGGAHALNQMEGEKKITAMHSINFPGIFYFALQRAILLL